MTSEPFGFSWVCQQLMTMMMAKMMVMMMMMMTMMMTMMTKKMMMIRGEASDWRLME